MILWVCLGFVDTFIWTDWFFLCIWSKYRFNWYQRTCSPSVGTNVKVSMDFSESKRVGIWFQRQRNVVVSWFRSTFSPSTNHQSVVSDYEQSSWQILTSSNYPSRWYGCTAFLLFVKTIIPNKTILTVSAGKLTRIHCTWLPSISEDDDRNHHILFKCSHCRPLSSACQYFGHRGEGTNCTKQQLGTVMDQPICNNPDCPEPDYMSPTHNLVQTFQDENENIFSIFFKTPAEVNCFFGVYDAKSCSEDDALWCKYVATLVWFKQRHKCGLPVVFEMTVEHQDDSWSVKDFTKRVYYVSGRLPCID